MSLFMWQETILKPRMKLVLELSFIPADHPSIPLFSFHDVAVAYPATAG